MLKLEIGTSIRKELLRYFFKSEQLKPALIDKAKNEGYKSVKAELVSYQSKFYILPVELTSEKGQEFYKAIRNLDFSSAKTVDAIDENIKKDDLEIKMEGQEAADLSSAFSGIKIEQNNTSSVKNDSNVNIQLPKYTPATSKMWARICLRLLEGTSATETKKITLVLNSLSDEVLTRAYVLIDESTNILAKDLVSKIDETSKRTQTEIKKDLDKIVPSENEPTRVTFTNMTSLIKEQHPSINSESAFQLTLLTLENALPSYVRDHAIFKLREHLAHDSNEEKRSAYFNLLDTLLKSAKSVNAISPENYTGNRSSSRGRWQGRSDSRQRFRSKSRDSRRSKSRSRYPSRGRDRRSYSRDRRSYSRDRKRSTSRSRNYRKKEVGFQENRRCYRCNNRSHLARSCRVELD